MQAVGRTGEVVSIDRSRLVALLQFYDSERAVSEEWWFPLQSLSIANGNGSSVTPPNHTTAQEGGQSRHAGSGRRGDDEARSKIDTLRDTLLAAEMRLGQLYARGSIITLLKNWPDSHPLSLEVIGGPASFLKALRLIARAHLAQSVPELRQLDRGVEKGIMNLLWGQLRRLCQ